VSPLCSGSRRRAARALTRGAFPQQYPLPAWWGLTWVSIGLSRRNSPPPQPVTSPTSVGRLRTALRSRSSVNPHWPHSSSPPTTARRCPWPGSTVSAGCKPTTTTTASTPRPADAVGSFRVPLVHHRRHQRQAPVERVPLPAAVRPQHCVLLGVGSSTNRYALDDSAHTGTSSTESPLVAVTNAASTCSTTTRASRPPVLDPNRPDLGVTQETGQLWASPAHAGPDLGHDPTGVAPTPRRHTPGLRLQIRPLVMRGHPHLHHGPAGHVIHGHVDHDRPNGERAPASDLP
jgi:hypothetical protein